MIKESLLPILFLVALLGLLVSCESSETRAAGRGRKVVLRPPQTGSYIWRPVTSSASQSQERTATTKPASGEQPEEELVLRGGFR